MYTLHVHMLTVNNNRIVNYYKVYSHCSIQSTDYLALMISMIVIVYNYQKRYIESSYINLGWIKSFG